MIVTKIVSLTAASLLVSTKTASIAGAAALKFSTSAELAPMAINFFQSVRIPAAFITGSSLAACFSLSSRRFEDAASKSKLEKNVWLIYHVLALFSFLLSMNVVITSTASANMLLLTKGTIDENSKKFATVYQYLRENYGYEFTLVRWSFFSGLFSFLGCFGLRVLLEFGLLEKGRRRAALAVGLAVGALFFDLISFVNQRIYSWPNLGIMTLDLAKMYFRRLESIQPMELLSISCLVGSGFTVVSLLAKKMLSKEDDDETGRTP